MAWIQLQHHSTFNRELEFTSDMLDVNAYQFKFARGAIIITKNGEKIISSNGIDSLTVGETSFKKKKKFFFKELSSDLDSLLIEWGPFKGEKISFVERCNISYLNSLFKITNFTLCNPIFITKTKIEIDDPCGKESLALGCLAFFWMWYDESRRDATL